MKKYRPILGHKPGSLARGPNDPPKPPSPQELLNQLIASQQSQWGQIDQLSQAVVRLIETHSVAFRALFDFAGITHQDRVALHRELHACADLFILLHVIADIIKDPVPFSILQNVIDAPVNLEHTEPDRVYQIVLVMIAPKDMNNVGDSTEIMAITLQRSREFSRLIDGGPPDQVDTLAQVFIAPQAFQPLMYKQDSPERAFMEAELGTDSPEGLQEFLKTIDVKAHIEQLRKLRSEEVKIDEAKEEGADVLITPESDTAPVGDNVIIFGGQPSKSTDVDEQMEQELQSALSEPADSDNTKDPV